MVQTALDLVNAGAQDAKGILGALPGLAADGAALYVKEGTPSGPIPNVGVGLARAACRKYADDPGRVPGSVATGFERVCRPYLDDIGYGSGPQLNKPFSGGQCVGVRYRVTISANSILTSGETQEPPTITTHGGGVGFPGPILKAEGVGAPAFQSIRLFYGEGQFEDVRSGNCQQGCFRNIKIVSVVRVDGLADECGSPPPVVTQPRPPVVIAPRITPIIVAPDVDIEGEVNINIDGSITFDFGVGDITINPFGGGGDGEPGGGDGSPGSGPGAPTAGPELPGGNGGFGGDDGFGEPPVGMRWCGACIRVVPSNNNQPPIPGTPPEDVYPTVIGNIRLVGNGGGVRIVDTPSRISAKGVCVWEPVRGFNPVAVNVDLLPGYGYVYRPYAVKLEA